MGVYRRTYTKNGTKKVSRFWYCVDPATGRERSLRVTDKAIAEIMLGDLRKARELRRAGIDTFEPARRADPNTLLEPYLADMARRRCAEDYRYNTATHLRWWFGKVRRLEELTPATIGALIATRTELLPRTQNFYLKSLSGFFNWLIREGRWHTNPVKAVPRAKVRGNEAFDRWALTLEQLTALVDGVPIHRAAVYVLAGNTGLRRGELGKLLEANLDLEAGTVRVRASIAKDAEDDNLPLNPWTVEVLRRYLEAVPPDRRLMGQRGRTRGARLFCCIPEVRTLQADLRAHTGLDPINAAGERFDFHALRTTFATLLAREGVHPAVAKDLLRHADIRMTMSVYTRLTLHDARAAVAKIQPRRAADDRSLRVSS